MSIFSELAVTPQRLKNHTAIGGYLRTLCQDTGIANLSYLGVYTPLPDKRENFTVTTYCPEWVQRYFESGYLQIDPVVHKAIAGIVPLDWADVDKSSQPIKNFFGEAHEFGVANQGLSIPIRGRWGDRALLTLNSEMPDREWKSFVAENLASFWIIAHNLHQSVMELQSQPGPEIILAPREAEVLQWAARGKSAWETATILQLSPRTVEIYLRSAAIKLGAANKTHAVALAARYELIS